MQEIDTTAQFLLALEAIHQQGLSYNTICDKAGIDRRNLMRLKKDPSHHYPRPQWLTNICTAFNVSPDYLILARGSIFTI